MKKTLWILLLVTACLPLIGAEPPERLNYQGVLRDAAGTPRDGTFTMVFRFFDAGVGGSELLVNQPAPVSVTQGLFNVPLGSGSVTDGAGPGTYASLSALFADFGDLFMEIEVDGEILSPRVELASSAYALNSARLDGRSAAEFLDTSAAPQSKSGALQLADLEVTGGLTLGVGSPGIGRVLTSDGAGNASWQDLPAMAGDTPLGMLADRLEVDDPQTLPFAALGGFDCSGANTATMALTLNGVPTGDVVGFVGHETISQPFEYLIAIESLSTINAAAQIGSDAVLTITRNAVATTFSGRVTEFGLAGSDGTTQTYVVRIEPKLSLLERRVDYAIFQAVNLSDVISVSLSDEGLGGSDFEISLTGSYPTYDTAIRYNESTLAFLSRLMEEEGVHYHFVESGGDRVRFVDDNAGFPALGSYGYYGDQVDPGTGEEYLSTLHLRERERIGSHTIRGWLYESATFSSASAGTGLGERYEFYAEDVDGSSASRRRVNATNRDRILGEEQSGTSNIVDLRAGRTFDVGDTTLAGFAGNKLVTSVTHFAVRDSDPTCIAYGNRFTSIPSSIPYAPPRRTPKPVVNGPMTASVTDNGGPVAETYGRVKVEFHWDRAGQSTGWVRVAVPAGRLDEQQWIPEVDDEVIVDFLQGDPDRPVVVGSLHNGASVPLPDPGARFMKQSGPDQDQTLYFLDGGDPLAEHLRWDDAQTRFELTDDLFLGGERIDWNSGSSLQSTSFSSLFALGHSSTSDALIYAGSSISNGALRIFGSSTFESRSGSGLFTWVNGSTSTETARLDAAGNFQIDGIATVSGGGLFLGSGPSMTGSTVGLTLAGGLDNTDDLILRAGNDNTDGQLQILGDSTATLYIGNGLFNLIAGDTNEVMGINQTSATLNEWKFTGANLELYLGDSAADNTYVPGDLTVSGVKNFVQNHPQNQSLSVVYTALEGDEVGTYTRGSARLRDGFARVPLGATFRWTTNPELGLTAHVTARSQDADLWVEQVSTTELVVRAQPGSDPDAAFDYIVHGLRVGYEEFSVVQPRRLEAPVPSAESYERYYQNHDGLREFTAARRYATASRSVGGEATGAMLRAIGTFEPDLREGQAPETTGGDRFIEPPRAQIDSIESTASGEIESPSADEEPALQPARVPSVRTRDPELATAVEVSDNVELGDLVVLDPDSPDHMVASTRAGDPTVIGIVAGRPGLLLGGANDDDDSIRVPLAFSGLAMVKADAGYGAIRAGDLLTASPTRGHAMRADDPAPGTIVAKALESLETGSALIRVLVTLR